FSPVDDYAPFANVSWCEVFRGVNDRVVRQGFESRVSQGQSPLLLHLHLLSPPPNSVNLHLNVWWLSFQTASLRAANQRPGPALARKPGSPDCFGENKTSTSKIWRDLSK